MRLFKTRNFYAGVSEVVPPSSGNSLYDLLGDIARDVMFDTECVAESATYCIKYPDETTVEFTIPWVREDDDSLLRDATNTTERKRTIHGWVPLTYVDDDGILQDMPKPDDCHFVRPDGQSVYFKFRGYHEKNPAGYLCSFSKTDIRSFGGFDAARRS